MVPFLGSDYRVFDLGQEISKAMPEWPAHPPFVFGLLRRHGDTVHADGTCGANEILVMSGHTATHIDALGHVSQDGRFHGGADAFETQKGEHGLRSHGVDQVGPIVGRGVLLDLYRLFGGPLEPGYEVTVSDLERAQEQAGCEVREGDTVVLRTGWGAFWHTDKPRYLSMGRGQPGPGVAAARWLAERKIRATGSDTFVYECFGPAPNAMPVHSVLLVEHGIYIMENLNLEALGDDGVGEFLFVALPLPLKGATGSPIRPVAIAR